MITNQLQLMSKSIHLTEGTGNSQKAHCLVLALYAAKCKAVNPFLVSLEARSPFSIRALVCVLLPVQVEHMTATSEAWRSDEVCSMLVMFVVTFSLSHHKLYLHKCSWGARGTARSLCGSLCSPYWRPRQNCEIKLHKEAPVDEAA